MCGILGYATLGPRPDPKVYEAFKKMFCGLEERGRDASGFAYIENGELKFHKHNVSASKLVQGDEFKALEDRMPKILIAHCRLKTQGSEKKNVNNHPVVDKKFGWALVHNGVIWNDFAVFEKFKLKREGDVDTEAILRLFQKYMVENIKTAPATAIKRAVASLRGQATFAMVGEEHPERLYLYKGGNPLSIVYVEAWQTVFFASRAEYIRKVLMETEVVFGNFRRKMDTFGVYVHDEIKDESVVEISVEGGKLSVETKKARLGSSPAGMPSSNIVYFSKGDENTGDHGPRHRTPKKYQITPGYWQDGHGNVHRDAESRARAHERPLSDYYNLDEELRVSDLSDEG